nr:hypothetical protein [uncultured Acetatifactor sp.]
MKMTGKAFAKKLFGAKYERLPRTLFVDLIVFWGLYIAGFQVRIAPSVRIFLVSAFTAGVMWQALSARDNAVEIEHMLMLPLGRGEFVFSYVAALGAYAAVTKTGLLLAVLLAVSSWRPMELLGIAVCMIHAVLLAAAAYSLRRHWYVGVLWAIAVSAAILLFGSRPWMVPLLAADGLLAVLLLGRAEGYDFCQWEGGKGHAVRRHRNASLWRYFFRYMGCHRNYLANTAVMWGVAVVLLYFLGEMAGLDAMPIGFAILCLNTPVCILLSCDRDLEQAVRFLPGQRRAFCIPYCLFLFGCNMAANGIYLCSWQIQKGSVAAPMVAGALFFALQSAILSVLLEWLCPIRDWKIESDLWHHPRKYVVPAGMLLLAGGVGAWPMLLTVLWGLLAGEAAVLLWICLRRPEG